MRENRFHVLLAAGPASGCGIVISGASAIVKRLLQDGDVELDHFHHGQSDALRRRAMA